MFLLAVAVITAMADDQIRFTGSAKNVVSVGERFRVTYEINNESSSFQSPDFKTLQVLSGPSTSTNSSIQYVNGRMTQSYSNTFTFIVQATEEGDVVIGPASITVGKTRINSNTIKIKVVKGNSSQAQSGQTRGSGSTTSNSGVLQKDDVYIKATISDASPYLGEQVVLTYKIYTRVPVSNLMVKKLSSFEGFWSKSLMDNKSQYKQTTEVINGDEYVVAEINKFALFPQKSGKITIEPTEIDCSVQLRVQNSKRRTGDPFNDFFNDPFFNRNVKNIQTTIKSNPLTIDVKPLPQQGKPQGFNGAVGNFKFNSNIDRDNLNANDALTVTYTVSGRGNLELINLDNVKFPVDFEVFDPKITSNINTSDYGLSGNKKFEYLAIPRNAGDFVIKPVELSYFNPGDGKYHTLNSEAFKIHVEKGEDNQGGGLSYSSSAQEDIRFIGQDIHHIKLLPFKLKKKGDFLFMSQPYFIVIGIVVLLVILMIVFAGRMEARRSNISLVKNRKANKVARSRLKSAEKFKKENNDNGFYDEIAQALWGYIIDKFNLKKSELSMDNVSDLLNEKGVEKDVTESFIAILNNIEFARFAPGDASDKMENIYNESVEAIMKAEKALK